LRINCRYGRPACIAGLHHGGVRIRKQQIIDCLEGFVRHVNPPIHTGVTVQLPRDIVQVHSEPYRNPHSLPPSAPG
jgi:hypothetical protein